MAIVSQSSRMNSSSNTSANAGPVVKCVLTLDSLNNLLTTYGMSAIGGHENTSIWLAEWSVNYQSFGLAHVNYIKLVPSAALFCQLGHTLLSSASAGVFVYPNTGPSVGNPAGVSGTATVATPSPHPLPPSSSQPYR